MTTKPRILEARSERASTGDIALPERTYRIEILLVSFAALLLEISYTRVISFKLYYYYTYLVIGLALLGIGSGGVVIAISARLRRAPTDVIMMWSLLLGAASIGAGYLIVARTSTNTLAIWDSRGSVGDVALVMLICLALFASFVAAGIIIATLFGRQSQAIGRLYFADLAGAGLGCAVVVLLISSIGPPATIMLAGLILALAGLRIAARRRSRVFPLNAALVVVLAVAVLAPGVLPDVLPDAQKSDLTRTSQIMYSSWSPIFRVDVVQVTPDVRFLYHDGLVGSAIYRFNGNPASLTRFNTDPRLFPFAVTGTAPANVMIIGAAGGNEVLTSLYFHARHVDAIELNPVTYKLVTDDFAAYDGHLAQNRKVNYVNGDGRSYLARSNKKYDLIWFPAPDSYAAANGATAGAFVLSESYLYTSEAIAASLKHLKSGGIVATELGDPNFETRPVRTTRYIATARQALAKLGIRDPRGHILVATSGLFSAKGNGSHFLGGTLSTILVKATRFTPAEIDRFARSLSEVPGSTLRYAPGHPEPSSPITAVMTSTPEQLDNWYWSYRYDVRPITDNAPFFYHYARFNDVLQHFSDPVTSLDPEAGIGERVLLLLLGVAMLLAAVFLLLPFAAIRRTWAALPRKGASAIYFAALGFGFIFFEITLIQRLVLFLGYPTYSLTVTLMSLLIFTGLGALLSTRFSHRLHRALPVVLIVLVALTLFYEIGLGPMTDALLGVPLAMRVVVAFAVLAPLGLCLGLFMPTGLGVVARLTEHSREYVAWGWAVNGFASVIGAVLATLLAIDFGFRLVLLLALVSYIVAVVALAGLLRQLPNAPIVPGPD